MPFPLVVLGRFHTALVHFPIALALVALLIELALRRADTDNKRRAAVTLLLGVGAAGAVAASITGLVYAAAEDFHGSTLALVVQHRTSALVTSVVLVAAFVAYRKVELQKLALPLLGFGCIGVAFAGHLGGELVHGEGYLFEPAEGGGGDKGNGGDDDSPHVASDGDEGGEEARARQPEGQVPDKPDYDKHIKPLLDRSCTKCHGPEKRKGGLRLDKKRFAFKGGEDGPAIVAGDPTKSPLYTSVALPPEDEDVMPAKGKLLALSEIETIKKWIEQGAAWPDDGEAQTSMPDMPSKPATP